MSFGPAHRQRQCRHAAHRHRLGEGPLDRDGLAQPVEPCVPGRRDEGAEAKSRGRPQHLREAVEGTRLGALSGPCQEWPIRPVEATVGRMRSIFGAKGPRIRAKEVLHSGIAAACPYQLLARTRRSAGFGRPSFAVPGPVEQVGVVVGDLGAVQPVDGHAGAGEPGIVARVHCLGAGDGPEAVLVLLDRAVSCPGGGNDVVVVVVDVRGAAVARRRGDEQQPEAAGHPGGDEVPARRHGDRAGRSHRRGAGDRLAVDLVPRLVAEFRQVEFASNTIGLRGDAPAVQGNTPAAHVEETARAQRDAVRIEIRRPHRVCEVQIARAGAGIVHRRARHPADIEHQVGRARHRHGLAEVDPHLDGLARRIARGSVHRGRGDRDAERF